MEKVKGSEYFPNALYWLTAFLFPNTLTVYIMFNDGNGLFNVNVYFPLEVKMDHSHLFTTKLPLNY